MILCRESLSPISPSIPISMTYPSYPISYQCPVCGVAGSSTPIFLLYNFLLFFSFSCYLCFDNHLGFFLFLFFMSTLLYIYLNYYSPYHLIFLYSLMLCDNVCFSLKSCCLCDAASRLYMCRMSAIFVMFTTLQFRFTYFSLIIYFFFIFLFRRLKVKTRLQY